VTPPGEEITDSFKGNRVALLTFGIMYTMLSTGSSPAQVNLVLERNAQQVDGLVLSESEGAFIRNRIDQFNAAIMSAAASHGPDAWTRISNAILGEVLSFNSVRKAPPTLLKPVLRNEPLSKPGRIGRAPSQSIS